MRDIKFRAYIKFLQRMSVVTELLNHGKSAMTDGYPYALSHDDMHLMQFTGLKDSNGVEIYEGDVVEVQYDFDEPTIHKVEWGGIDYPAFELTPDLGCECNGFSQYYNDPDTTIKVIGNIHENPELLND